MEGKQNIPSVIARLMGLDEMPPQQPLHRQQKVLSEDYLRKTASIGLLEKSSLSVGRLSGARPKKQDKHIYSSEIPRTDKGCICSVSYEANPRTENIAFGFSVQRNECAKCDTMDKKLYHSKRIYDVLEDPYSSKNNLLSDFDQPDCLTKHIGKVKALQPHLCSDNLSAPLSFNPRSSEVCKKSEKMITQRTILRSLQKLENGDKEPYIVHLNKLLKAQLELKDKLSYSPTRIVVLKPNSGKAKNCARDLLLPVADVLSQSSDAECRDHCELLKLEIGKLDTKVSEIANATSHMEIPRHSFRVTRGMAKRTAQDGNQDIGSSPRGLPNSRITVDESSANCPEALITSSQNSFECMERDPISYPFPSGSIFSTEARKQIFERWKATKNSQEVEVAGRRCTLSEMFAMHDGRAMTINLDSKLKRYSLGTPLSGNSEFGSPLQVGSKDSKTKYIRNLRRSNLSKNSTVVPGSPNLRTVTEASRDSCLGLEEAVADTLNMSKSKNFLNGGSTEPRDPRADWEKHHHRAGSLYSHNIEQNIVSHNLPSCNREAEQKSTVSKLSAKSLDAFANKEVQVSSENQPYQMVPCTFHMKDEFHDVQENLTPQRSSCYSLRGELVSRCKDDPDLAMNLKEINQPSPDSVLEPPFKEENPAASEFLDSPIADLSGLAMKLQLLDTRSEETYSESSGIAVSSDEDTDKESLDLSQYNEKVWEKFKPEESRDFSYLIDVLDEVNLWDGNMDMLYETWHAMECQVNGLVFEALEKKYGKQTSWKKSERRLLFDRINYGLMEILNSCLDVQIFAKHLRRRFCPILRRDEIEEELWTLLISQEKEVSNDLSKKALGREVKWLELEEDIGFICKEIEQFLLDELTAELVST